MSLDLPAAEKAVPRKSLRVVVALSEALLLAPGLSSCCIFTTYGLERKLLPLGVKEIANIGMRRRDTALIIC